MNLHAGRKHNETIRIPPQPHQLTQSQDPNRDGHVRGSVHACAWSALITPSPFICTCVRRTSCCVCCIPVVSGVVIFSHDD